MGEITRPHICRVCFGLGGVRSGTIHRTVVCNIGGGSVKRGLVGNTISTTCDTFPSSDTCNTGGLGPHVFSTTGTGRVLTSTKCGSAGNSNVIRGSNGPLAMRFSICGHTTVTPVTARVRTRLGRVNVSTRVGGFRGTAFFTPKSFSVNLCCMIAVPIKSPCSFLCGTCSGSDGIGFKRCSGPRIRK